MKKLVSILLAMVLILGICGSAMFTVSATEVSADVWDGTANIKWYLDGPNADGAYELNSAEDLAGLAFIVGSSHAESRYVGVYYRADGTVAGYASGTKDTGFRDLSLICTDSDGLESVSGDNFMGKKVVLNVDVVLNEGNAADWETTAPANLWQPIGGNYPDGAKMTSFTGTFDGQGHTISGLYYKAAANYVAGGLFGWVSSKFPAAFKNLTLNNFYVEGEVVGGLLGRTNGQVTVDNVMLTNGTVKNAGSQTGAFIGGVFEGPAVFRYCGVENVAVCGNKYVGFFAGVAVGQEISVTDCYVKDSSATGDAEVGVLSGRMMGGSISIQNLYVIAELEATSTNIDSADFTPSAGVVYGAAANGQKPAARFVDGFFYVATVTSIIVNEDISDKGAAVTLDQISGNAAKIIMASFDYENVWKIVADGTPVIELRGDMLDDGKEDNGGDEFMDNNNDEEETKKPAKTEAPTSETTPMTTDGTTAEEKSGCGSMVGFTGLALTAMLAGAAVMLKKEN